MISCYIYYNIQTMTSESKGQRPGVFRAGLSKDRGFRMDLRWWLKLAQSTELTWLPDIHFPLASLSRGPFFRKDSLSPSFAWLSSVSKAGGERGQTLILRAISQREAHFWWQTEGHSGKIVDCFSPQTWQCIPACLLRDSIFYICDLYGELFL